MAIRSDGSVMSPPPGFVTRGCKRAFLVADGRDVTAVELFEWCYPRRSRRKRVRLSVRDGDETFLDRSNAYRAVTKGCCEDGSESRQSVARRRRVASAWGKVRFESRIRLQTVTVLV
jgi:hypothetical protein